MRTISLLGSTGSIGRQSLDVIAACRMSVAAVTANRSVELLEQQVRQFPARTGSLLCPRCRRRPEGPNCRHRD